jgi:tetratricopeptide (TPR) repeat protein
VRLSAVALRVPALGLRSWPATAALALVLALTALTGSAGAQAPTPANAQALIQLGDFYYSRGEFAEAEQAFIRALNLEPRNAVALVGLGRSRLRQNKIEAAINNFNEAISIDASLISAYVALSQAYRSRGESDPSAAAQSLQQALRILADAARIAPDNAAVHNERAFIHQIRGELDLAVASYREALRHMPDSPARSIILFNLGTVYFSQRRWSDAVETFGAAVEQNPSSPSIRGRFGLSLFEHGRALQAAGNAAEGEAYVQRAASELTQAVALDSSSVQNVGNLGVVLFELGRFGEAARRLTQATNLEPVLFPDFYYFLGRSYYAVERYQDAKAALTKAVFLVVGTAVYHYWLARANEALGEHDGACAQYRLALERAGGRYPEASDGLIRLRCN